MTNFAEVISICLSEFQFYKIIVAAVTSRLLTIVKTGITIVSYFGNVTVSLFAPTIVRLEVLIEKGSAAVSCDANKTKTVCRTVEHMNSFLLKSIT